MLGTAKDVLDKYSLKTSIHQSKTINQKTNSYENFKQ